MTNEAERRYFALALRKEHYRRSFETYAIEQLKVQTKLPGVIAPLDINKKPLQQLCQAAVNEQWKAQGYVRLDILKGRQQGSSTYSQGLTFWKCSTSPNYSTILIAQDDPTTSSIFEKARFFYEHLDGSIRPLIRRSNKREIVFASPDHKNPSATDLGLNSRMDFQAATNINAGTGTTRQGYHLSELAKWKPDAIQILVASIFPCLPDATGTIGISESTAFVGGNWFRERCEQSRSGKVDRKFVFGPWYIEPDYQIPLLKGEKLRYSPEEKDLIRMAAKGQPADGVPPWKITAEQIKWRRKKIEDFGDPRLFMQEYAQDWESCWISFDHNVFDPNALYYQRRHLANPIRTVRVLPGLNNVVTDNHQLMSADTDYQAIFEEPVKGEIYDIGADVALGNDGGDWSTAVVFKRRTMEQVAELHLHIDPRDFGTLLYWFGFFYNTAQVAPEWNSVGIPVVNELQRLSYPYLYWWRKRDGAVPILSKKVGWETSRTSKPTMVSLFRKRLNDAWKANNGTGVKIRSRVLMAELQDYVQIPWGDVFEYRADKGHDDLTMAAQIAMVALDDESFGRLDEGMEKTGAEPAKDHDIAVMDRPFGYRQFNSPFAGEMK